jgi:hypothetical protein
MLRGGWRGIREIPIIGIIFSKRIPIGANTGKVSAMTRDFLNNTNMGRLESGKKDSVVTPLLQPLQADSDQDQARLKWPRPRDRDQARLEWPRQRYGSQALL